MALSGRRLCSLCVRGESLGMLTICSMSGTILCESYRVLWRPFRFSQAAMACPGLLLEKVGLGFSQGCIPIELGNRWWLYLDPHGTDGGLYPADRLRVHQASRYGSQCRDEHLAGPVMNGVPSPDRESASLFLPTGCPHRSAGTRS